MTPFLERYGQGSAQPGRDWYHPLSGWFLVETMRLEDVRPGILAFATRAPPLWRNAVAAAMSSGILSSPQGFLLQANGDVGEEDAVVQIADALMAMKPRSILDAAYVEVPPSLPAILKKIGSSLLNTADAYVRLHALLTSDKADQRARARVLEKLDARLDDEVIQVVEVLDLAILSPKTAMAVRTATDAHKVNTRLPVIQQVCSTANLDALRQSIEDAPSFQASNWMRRWLRKADRLPRLGIPLDDDPGAERIAPATARRIGQEWKNCLAGHTNAMALGSTAYFALSDLNVIVVLTRTDGGWLLSGVHGRANMTVRPETARRVQQRLTPLGVVCHMPLGPPPEVRAIEGAFHGVDDLDFEFDGMTVPG